MYQNGLGQVRNQASAYRWMKCAADQDHGLALHALGYMYLDGDCTNPDGQKAVACFEKAVELGFEGSKLALAQMALRCYVSAPSSRCMAPLAVREVTVMFYEATGT